MKILSLNTWGGRAGKKELLAFLKRYTTTVDIFCLQEVWSAPYEQYEGVSAGGLAIQHGDIMVHGLTDITAAMSDFNFFFHPHFMDSYGLLMLVKNDVAVKGSGDFWVHKEKGYIPHGDIGLHARNVQYVTIFQNNQLLTVCNFHGLWNGKGKTDSPDRLIQSKNIIASLNSMQGEKIIMGDFNLLPNTESIRILETSGFCNLISEYGITSTRTSFYSKPEKYADYAFITAGVSTRSFEVLSDEVSDHAPLMLEIE